jgi:hypothetical protein
MNEEFDLDALLASAMERQQDQRAAAKAKAKPAYGRSKAEQQLLLDYETKHIWHADCVVGLVHAQICNNCSRASEWFAGWFMHETHATDRFASRLVAGRTAGNWPIRRERHVMRPVDHCPSCIDDYIATENHRRDSAHFTLPERKHHDNELASVAPKVSPSQTDCVLAEASTPVHEPSGEGEEPRGLQPLDQ